jgi:hypothetical protein
VQEILVDRRELVLQDGIEMLNDTWVAAHDRLPPNIR